MIKDIEIKYSVGALLYTPALNGKIAEAVINGKFDKPYSLALCLEDTIGKNMIEAGENQAVETLRIIHNCSSDKSVFIPKIFIRVRTPEQMMRLYKMIEEYTDVFTGFIIPKYTVTNASLYNKTIFEINGISSKKIWIMPILESKDIVEPVTRKEILEGIRNRIDSIKDYVLNVRVGGNDFSNQFAARRHYDETIYDILPIAQLLGDILSFFSMDYVVSGAVWEFFSSDNDEWRNGLRNELKYDKLNGFIGKTVIHPKQISVVNEMLKVTNKDFEDAKTILNWDSDGLQVGKSFGGERMNEVRTHYNWARKIVLLSELYGIN